MQPDFICKIEQKSNCIHLTIVRVGENINTRPAKPPNSETAKMESSVLSGIIQLKTTIGQLENEEERLETTIEQNRAQIKSLLMNKKNLEAKSLLRRTKVLEKSLNQKQTQLNNLEKMLLDIQSAAENRNIVRVLGSVNEALKLAVGGSDALNKAEDIVSDVMESIHESQEGKELLILIRVVAQQQLCNNCDYKDSSITAEAKVCFQVIRQLFISIYFIFFAQSLSV
ncbi:unnamed protein product [Trichobilharzia regenti]|nr:unnamed protein product [Trichobilharzia regenti]